MSDTGNSSQGIRILKVVAIVAVVVAVAGLAFVIVQHSTRSPGTASGGPSESSSVASSGEQDATPAGTAAARRTSAATGAQGTTRPAGTASVTPGNATDRPSVANVTQFSGRSMVTGTGSRATDTAGVPGTGTTSEAAGRRPRTPGTSPSGNNADTVVEAPQSSERLVADKAVVYIPHAWDDTSGELLVGDQRYLTKLGAMQRTNQDAQTLQTIRQLRETMRNRVDFQLKDINEEIRVAVESYQKAIADGNREEADNYHHMVTKHLVFDRQTILDTVDRQLDELIQEALPGR
ncbi:MAG: hypothetical protein GXY74_16485 [Phycisphaerae bacterium]|nr:hypothetical protein [Phycisphaerae bacterium]